MKKSTNSPYTTFGLEKINAPKKSKGNEPKASKINSQSDLRSGGKK